MQHWHILDLIDHGLCIESPVRSQNSKNKATVCVAIMQHMLVSSQERRLQASDSGLYSVR